MDMEAGSGNNEWQRNQRKFNFVELFSLLHSIGLRFNFLPTTLSFSRSVYAIHKAEVILDSKKFLASDVYRNINSAI